MIEGFDPARGGRERSTADVAHELARQGCEVDVVCMTAGEMVEPVRGFPLYGPPGQVPVRTVPLGPTGRTRAGRLERFLAAAAENTAAGGYDIVHAMLPMVQADVYQLRGGTVPGLFEAHLRMLGPAGRAVRRLTWRCNRARQLLARQEARLACEGRVWCLPVSDLVAAELERHYGRTERVRTVFNAVAVPALTDETRTAMRADVRGRLGFGDEDLVWLCPAMNFQLKGVGEMIEAFAALRQARSQGPRQRLVVIGRDRPEGFDRAIGLRSAGDDVRFLPPTDQIWEMYAAADAVVLLSWYDPCSRVVLEATALGIPSLTTARNGAAEALRDGAGLVVESPADREGILAAMRRLAEPATRAACRQAARAQAPQLSVARHVEELLGVYREVAKA